MAARRSADEVENLVRPSSRTSTNYGDIAVRAQNNVKPGLVCLLIAVALERITFYTVTMKLTDFFLDVLHLSNATAVNTYLVVSGTSDFLPLFGGILGDSLIERYVCLVVGFSLEAIGSIFLLVLMCLGDEERGFTLNASVVFTGLIIMAIGLCFQRANVIVIGCKQVSRYEDQKSNVKAVEGFVRCYYWAINLGSFVALMLLYLVDPLGHEDQGDMSRTKYVGISQTVAGFLAVFFVIIGKKWYIRTRPDGENLKKFRRGILNLFNCKRRRESAMNSLLQSYNQGPDQIAKDVFKILLLMANLLLFRAINIMEWGNIFLKQGSTMDMIANTTTPTEVMSSFNTITILVVLPFIHFLITPCLARSNRNVPLLKRIGAGLLFACLSALSCGILEAVRHKYYGSCHCLSIFWQLPQFIFLSLGEIFALVTAYQFMYLESHSHLEGLYIGLVFCLFGVGTYFSQMLSAIVSAATDGQWYPVDYNQGHVEYFLFVLVVLQFLFFLLFAWYAHYYKYRVLYTEAMVSRPASRVGAVTVTSQNYGSLTSTNDSLDSYLDSLASQQ